MDASTPPTTGVFIGTLVITLIALGLGIAAVIMELKYRQGPPGKQGPPGPPTKEGIVAALGGEPLTVAADGVVQLPGRTVGFGAWGAGGGQPDLFGVLSVDKEGHQMGDRFTTMAPGQSGWTGHA